MTGIRVTASTWCDICDEDLGPSWDVHMILQHPETRPKPEVLVSTKKKGKKK